MAYTGLAKLIEKTCYEKAILQMINDVVDEAGTVFQVGKLAFSKNNCGD